MELNRKERILKLIVEEFIRSAEPVGSSTLIEQYNLPYSSATIRNEMADLEKMGFLEKTHTSSGRVPSSLGYRYYVDHLKEANLDQNIKNQLATIFQNYQGLTIDEAIKHSCEIISQLTNLTSVVLGPDSDKEKMQKIQLVKVDENTAVAIFITDLGHVEHNTFIIPNGLNYNDLETCINIINDRIVGTPISKVVEKVEAMKPLLAEKVEKSELLFREFVEAFLKFTYERVSVYGRDQLFEHKELTNDLEKLKKFVTLLDSSEFFNSINSSEGIRVRIGNENTINDLEDVSVISAQINVGGSQKGSINLVGPTRMDYSKVIGAIEYLQQQLNEFFIKGDDDDGRK